MAKSDSGQDQQDRLKNIIWVNQVEEQMVTDNRVIQNECRSLKNCHSQYR